MCARKAKDGSKSTTPSGTSTGAGGTAAAPKTVTGTIRIPIDFDPTKTTSRFSKTGVEWLLQQRYFLGISPKPDEGKAQLEAILERVGDEGNELVEPSALLNGLNLQDQTDAEKAIEILKQNQDTPEWWAFVAGTMSNIAREALDKNDTRQGMWAVSVMYAARSMMIFKQSIEASMWRGYTTALMRSVLDIWEQNKGQTDEEFWQTTLTDNSLILSQLFAFPVVVLKGKAYLGGKGIDNAGGKLVDFLISNELTQNTALVEIKTPKTPLLGTTEYRAGVFPASIELSGSVNQALSYKDTLGIEYLNVLHNSTDPFHAFNPQCLVIAGNYGEELKTKEQKRSFELFRASLKDIQVITYDEIFAKLEALLKLLGV